MLDVFSEHKAVIGSLVSLHSNNHLPHAVLMTSVSGVGLTSAASSLCATFLCERNNDESCGECSSCSRVSAGTHGDYRWLKVAEGKASIGVDQIREAGDFVTKTAGYGSQKILVISDAEKMTTGASNALLKTLEEPQGSSLLCCYRNEPGCYRLRFARDVRPGGYPHLKPLHRLTTFVLQALLFPRHQRERSSARTIGLIGGRRKSGGALDRDEHG